MSRPAAAPPSGPGPKLALVRITLFYLAVAAVLVAVVRWFPSSQEIVLLDGLVAGSETSNGEITRTMTGGVPLAGSVPTGWRGVWVTAVSLVGALVIMIPVSWTYVLIKRDQGYDASVVHTLLILPVAVAGIVTIVQGSLALAFSLAGIVAAVRFRTTLDDTKDAVYVFLAIGVGLAAGVQALGVAIALSVVFNVVNLVLWRLNFGDIYADQLRWTGGLKLGAVVAGASSTKSAIGFGDRSVATKLAPDSLEEVKRTRERVRRILHSESDVKRERKQYSALLIFTPDPTAAQARAEPVLEEWTVRWQLAEVRPADDGPAALTYLVRLRAGVADETLLGALREADGDEEKLLTAAEIRSLREMASGG